MNPGVFSDAARFGRDSSVGLKCRAAGLGIAGVFDLNTDLRFRFCNCLDCVCCTRQYVAYRFLTKNHKAGRGCVSKNPGLP